MRQNRRLALLVISLVLASIAPTDVDADDASALKLAHFENEIRPLFIKNCVQCHGPKKSESGLRLDSAAMILRGGISGPAVVPGDRDSLLLKAVRHEDDMSMPPEKKLTNREISQLEQWVGDGANWPQGMKLADPSSASGPHLRSGPITAAERDFWSYQPILDPIPPNVVRSLEAGEVEGGATAIRNAIDRFVQARLMETGIHSRAPAEKRVLIRRATFDLTGLPPTPEEIDAFLVDGSPEAFAKVVERLLDSAAYGERWGRHWLDVVRYADTAGETGDYPTPWSYKYRNWVIDAFNDDKPYDQFIREQVAGDILAQQDPAISAEQYREMLTATGFIAISRRFGFDVENYHHLTIQDTIDTLGKSVLGLTLGCARCHDHKFDPVNTNDYYALYGVFESTRYSFPGSEEKKRSYDLFPDVPAKVAEMKKAEHDNEIAAIDAELVSLQGRRADMDATVKGRMFFGFEATPLGALPLDPWGTLEDVQVVNDAQSPYDNVFPVGSRGLKMPGNTGNNAFGRPLSQPYVPATTPNLFYNIDFQVVDKSGNGACRFYLGRGPGNSAAVEMAANATTFLVKNGANYEPICDLETGQWYSLQVTANLRTKKFSGAIATPGQRVTFDGMDFTVDWDGTIDRTFVDRYGPFSGVIPARCFDNLSVSTQPFLPLGKSLALDEAELGNHVWRQYLSDRRILIPDANRDGHAGFNVWHQDPLPIVGVNSSDETLEVPGIVPPNAFVVHPNPQEGVAIAWVSPLSGRLKVSGQIRDAHDCGDGVLWFVDRLHPTGFEQIATGVVEANSGSSLGREESPLEIQVELGDILQLAIMPKANHGCDLTQVEWVISEVGAGERQWDLVADVTPDLLSGNPHSDQYGDAPWLFLKVSEDRGQAENVAAPKRLAAADLLQHLASLEDLSQQITELTEQRAGMMSSPPYGLIYGAMDQETGKDAQVRIRGERADLGDVVPRKNLEILGDDALSDPSASGRLDLARWLTRPENTLTPRVMVNRIWQQHFGRGLVATENDFGTRGAPPTHPELLDWLASRFVENGWSVKAMHRLIMSSAAYQQASDYDPRAAAIDPDAALIWRFNRRRISAEEIRDAMLFACGDLDHSQGAEHPFPAESTWGFSQHSPYYGVYPSNRRSVYLMQQRLKRHPFLSLFDGADVNVSTARREFTTVPTQALFLMNSEFVHQCSANLTKRLLQMPDGKARVDYAYEVTLGRMPDVAEVEAVEGFVAKYRSKLASDATAVTAAESAGEAEAWAAFIRTLLTRNEFLFVD